MRLNGGDLSTQTSSGSLDRVSLCFTMNHQKMISQKRSTASWSSNTETSMRKSGESWRKFFTKKQERREPTRIVSITTMLPNGAENIKVKSEEEVGGDQKILDVELELLLTWNVRILQGMMVYLQLLPRPEGLGDLPHRPLEQKRTWIQPLQRRHRDDYVGKRMPTPWKNLADAERLKKRLDVRRNPKPWQLHPLDPRSKAIERRCWVLRWKTTLTS